MATIARDKDKKGGGIIGSYALLCDCGFTGRKVTDSEVWFSCERPVEPKVPACKIIHHLPKLLEVLEAKEKRREAEAFIATHEEKLSEAHAVLAIVPPEPRPKRGKRK